MTEALTAEHLTLGYPGHPPILERQNLTIRGGGRVALLGSNGSGKTTLLRALAGAQRPLSGSIMRGAERLGYSRRALRAHRRHVQLVLQDPDDQLFSADVTQDVSFGPMNLGLDEAQVRDRVAEALALLGIEHLATRATHQLSYGERKRVATAGAVAMRPQVLLLDEPTAGLDPHGTELMVEALDRMHGAGSTIVVATHDVELALRWADEVAVLHAGVITQGPVTAVMSEAKLMARAGLRRPWPLELADRLGLDARPRGLDEALAVIQGVRL